MSIGALSLKHHHECCKPKSNKAQSFSKKDFEYEQNNHKAAYISGSVGASAVLLITAYLFRGKIAKLPVFKKGAEIYTDIYKKLQNNGKKTIETLSEFALKTKTNIVKAYKNVVERYRNFFKK